MTSTPNPPAPTCSGWPPCGDPDCSRCAAMYEAQRTEEAKGNPPAPIEERRAPVQESAPLYGNRPRDIQRRIARGDKGFVPGTVAWSEHVEAWNEYAYYGHGDQSAERLAERGGFSYGELRDLLGHEPRTWRPR